jgi:DedD protein
MEKKKLLLVAVSVGVFLVIVVGAAILVFSPSGKPSAGTDWRSPNGAGLAASQPATADPRNMLNDAELRGLQNPAPAVQESATDTGNVTIDRNTGTVISIQRPQTAAVPDTTETEAAKPAQTAPAQAAPAQAAPPKESVKKTVAPVVPAAPAKPAVSAAPPPKKTSRNFWVQAGSYSSRERADNAKKILYEKGITAIITNQQVNGQTYYRVRIGPYTSRDDADYWLAMIKAISGFDKSYSLES